MRSDTGVTPPPRYSDPMSVAGSHAPHARGPVIPPGSMGASIRDRDRERDSLAAHSLLRDRDRDRGGDRSHPPPAVNTIDFATRHPSWDVPPGAGRDRKESYRGSGIAGIGAHRVGSPKEGSVLMARHMSPMHRSDVPMGSMHGSPMPRSNVHMNSERERASGSMPGYVPAPPKPTSVPRVQFSDPPESHRTRLPSNATQPPPASHGHPGEQQQQQHPADRRSYDSRSQSSWDSRDDHRGRSRRESYDSRDSREYRDHHRDGRDSREYQDARGSRGSVGGHSQLEPPPPITGGDGWGTGGDGWGATGGEGWPTGPGPDAHPPPGGSLLPPDPHPYGGGSKRGSAVSVRTATGKPGSVRSAHTATQRDGSIHQYGYAGDHHHSSSAHGHDPWDDVRSHRSGHQSISGAQTPLPPRPAELGGAGRQSSYSMAPIPVPPPASQAPSVASPGPGPPGGFGPGPPGAFEPGPPGGFEPGPPGAFDPNHDYFPPAHSMDANHPLDPYDPRPPLVVHPDFADSLDDRNLPPAGTDTNRFSFGTGTFNPHGKSKSIKSGSASPGEILPPGTKSPHESKDSKFFLVHDPDSGSLAKGAVSMTTFDQGSVLEGAAPADAAGGGGGGAKGKKKLKKGGKK